MTTTTHEAPVVHQKPGEGAYFAIFIVLAALTVTELLATYLPTFAKVPLMLGLAASKAWLVVQFYMHLRYDSKILTWAFLIPVLIGLIATLALQPLIGPIH